VKFSITAKRMKERRIKLGISVDTVADAIGVDRSTVFRYEKGDIEKISIDTLKPLAEVLRCTPPYLMGWGDEEAEEAGHKKSESSAFNFMVSMIAEIYGGVEEMTIKGKFAQTDILVFGRGKKSFYLEDKEIYALLDSAKMVIKPMVDLLIANQNFKEVVDRFTDAMNNPGKYKEIPGGISEPLG